MRRELKCPAPVWKPPVAAGQSWELEITVATPMFGGSDEPREVDAEHPVRAASVRGHLRFWWRATAGARYATVTKLWEAEETLWGGPSRPGRVSVEVETLDPGKVSAFASLVPKSSPRDGPLLGYFLFPFDEDKTEGRPAVDGRVGVRFRLHVSLSPSGLQDDSRRGEVESALRTWTMLGGIGARTRRGCGALLVPSAWRVPDGGALQAEIARCETGPELRHWATLSGGRAWVAPAQSDAMPVWQQLARFWAAFRKGHVGSTEYQPMRGSQWADWDTLLSRRSRPQGSNIQLAKPGLGLPIVFQKFDPDFYGPRLEADEGGNDARRMASPIILKPMALADGRWAPLILALRHPPPRRVRVDEGSFHLETPVSDPVLLDLEAGDPVDAVFKAAAGWGPWKERGREFRLGANP